MSILIAIIMLGIIIFLHELGHFLVAKLSGIRVEKFSIGYPPKIVGKKIGETEYQIGAVLFGGYVKLAGETEQSKDLEDPRAFLSKPPGTRILVLFAGPFMNFLTGFLILVFGFMIYGESKPVFEVPKIGTTVPGMPAHQCGIKPGDLILKVNGDTVKTWNELADLIHTMLDTEITLTVRRGDSVFNVICKTIARRVRTESGDTVFGMIGVIWHSKQVKPTPLKALVDAADASVRFAGIIVTFIVDLIVGRGSLHDVGGPIMIAQMAGQSAKQGFWQLMFFMAALSINLAVLNLIPLPILDGGQIVFTTFEAISRRRVSERWRAIFQQISIFILLMLMIFVTIKDVMNLF